MSGAPEEASFRDVLRALGRLRRGSRVKWWVATAVGSLILGFALAGILKVAVPSKISGLVEAAARDYGVDLRVENWRFRASDLAVVGEGVAIRTAGPFIRPEVIDVDRVVVDYSVGDLLRWSFAGPSSVRIERPRLYVERRLSGEWNWYRIVDIRRVAEGVSRIAGARALPDVAAASGPAAPAPCCDFIVDRLEFEDLDVTWVEHIPGASSEGVIRRSVAELHLDEVQLTIQDLAGLFDTRRRPAGRFFLEGRVGEGVVHLGGSARFFNWRQAPEDDGFALAGTTVWAPLLELDLYLENVSAQVLARFMPSNALLPESGALQGSVRFVSEGGALRCRGEVTLQRVRYRLNPSVDAERRRTLEPQLVDYHADGMVPVACDGSLYDRKFRPIQVLVHRATVAAAERAPLDVQRVVFEDQQRIEEDAVVPPRIEAFLRRVEDTTKAVRRVDETLQEVDDTRRQVEQTTRRFRLPKFRNPFR